MDLSHNSLSGSLKAFTVIPDVWSKLDLSHNNFFGNIPEAIFGDRISCVDMRFNELSGPLFDMHQELQDQALLAVRDALLGEAAGGAAGEAAGGTVEETARGTAFANGGNGSWEEILRSWGTSSSSTCAWYGVGCTADGHVVTLHLIGASNVTLHPNFVSESPECEYDEIGIKSCAHDFPPPPPEVRLTDLTSLRISGHVLSGTVQPSISHLSHLVALNLSSNRHLSGSIPPALFSLPSMRELSLLENNLTGEVLPTTTAAAAEAALSLSLSLDNQDAGRNALSRYIPADLSLLTRLTRQALDHNRLDGSLPRELRALWMLTDLQLQGNGLQGGVSALAATFPPPHAAAADNSAASKSPHISSTRKWPQVQFTCGVL
ncbi:unnamed protein product [Closterium sp. NIES-53]